MCILTAVSTVVGKSKCFRNVEVEDHRPLAKITCSGVCLNISLDDDDDDDDDDNDNGDDDDDVCSLL